NKVCMLLGHKVTLRLCAFKKSFTPKTTGTNSYLGLLHIISLGRFLFLLLYLIFYFLFWSHVFPTHRRIIIDPIRTHTTLHLIRLQHFCKQIRNCKSLYPDTHYPQGNYEKENSFIAFYCPF